MKNFLLAKIGVVAVSTVLLAACSSPQGANQNPAAPAAAAVDSPRVRADLQMYQQLLARKQYALAAPIGAGLLQRAPHSRAAVEVKKTLPDAQAKAAAINEKRRRAALWLYQTGEQSGGVQNTATIYPSTPAWAHGRVRLILRRHSDWGQSVYLYDTGDAGFLCKDKCKLELKVDGKTAKPLRGYLPETGEPAMFIDHDKAFLKLLKEADTLDLRVHGKGHDTVDLHFEVGGFDPARWPEAKAASKSTRG